MGAWIAPYFFAFLFSQILATYNLEVPCHPLSPLRRGIKGDPSPNSIGTLPNLSDATRPFISVWRSGPLDSRDLRIGEGKPQCAQKQGISFRAQFWS